MTPADFALREHLRVILPDSINEKPRVNTRLPPVLLPDIANIDVADSLPCASSQSFDNKCARAAELGDVLSDFGHLRVELLEERRGILIENGVEREAELVPLCWSKDGDISSGEFGIGVGCVCASNCLLIWVRSIASLDSCSHLCQERVVPKNFITASEVS